MVRDEVNIHDYVFRTKINVLFFLTFTLPIIVLFNTDNINAIILIFNNKK